MRVGQINCNEQWGGGEHQVLHLTQALAARGIDVLLFAHPDGELLKRALDSGLRAVGLPLRFGHISVARAAKMMRNEGVELLHTHDSHGSSLGMRLSRRLDIPVVLSRRVASPIRSNFISQHKYTRKNFAAVLAISNTVKDVFLKTTKYPAEDVYVVPTGVDIGELDAVRRDNAFRKSFGGTYLVGGVGKLSPKKNWQFLIRVAQRMQQSGLDIQWLIAGDGGERENLEALAAELGVAERVHLLGFRSDALQILKNLDALFFPSLVEGASVTVRECMVLGTPVVAVDAEGTMESLAGHGWAISEGDVEGAVTALREALINQKVRDEHVAAARRHAVEHYTYDRTLDGTLKVYCKVLALEKEEA